MSRRIVPPHSLLELGPGRLASISVLEAGKRFAVCHREPATNGSGDKGTDIPLSCLRAEVHVTGRVDGDVKATKASGNVKATSTTSNSGQALGLVWVDEPDLGIIVEGVTEL